MSTIHLYAPATVELQRSTLHRTYNAVAVHCTEFELAEELRAFGFLVLMHPLTGGDSGLKLVNNELAARQLEGAAIPVFMSTGVIAASGSLRLEYPGAFDPAQVGKFWPASALPGDLHLLLNLPMEDEELLQQVLSSAPANTIYAPQIIANPDFFRYLPQLRTAPAIVLSEADFARLAHQADPLAALTDFLDRGVNSAIVVQGSDRHWSAIAGTLRTTLNSQVSLSAGCAETDRFVKLLLPVAERLEQEQVLSAALVGALLELEQETLVPPQPSFLSNLAQAMHSFWTL